LLWVSSDGSRRLKADITSAESRRLLNYLTNWKWQERQSTGILKPFGLKMPAKWRVLFMTRAGAPPLRIANAQLSGGLAYGKVRQRA
jgi:hypothetical protein